MPLRVHLIAPALPPMLDGLGDHASQLALALTAAGVEVTILVPRRAAVAARAIAGVRVVPASDVPDNRRSVWDLLPLIAADRPDWVLLEYNPFSYGEWGLNLALPRAFAAFGVPSTRLALFAHEEFVLVHDWKHAVMSTWQRYQFRKLGAGSGRALLVDAHLG